MFFTISPKIIRKLQADITEIIMKRKREESSQTEKAFDTYVLQELSLPLKK